MSVLSVYFYSQLHYLKYVIFWSCVVNITGVWLFCGWCDSQRARHVNFPLRVLAKTGLPSGKQRFQTFSTFLQTIEHLKTMWSCVTVWLAQTENAEKCSVQWGARSVSLRNCAQRGHQTGFLEQEDNRKQPMEWEVLCTVPKRFVLLRERPEHTAAGHLPARGLFVRESTSAKSILRQQRCPRQTGNTNTDLIHILVLSCKYRTEICFNSLSKPVSLVSDDNTVAERAGKFMCIT